MGQSVGKGGRVGESGAEELLTQFATDYYQQTQPLRTETINQMMEALKTGGVNAQLPFVQKATESAKAATSNALKQLDERLAGTGMGSSPYMARARGDILTSGALAQSQIGPEFAAGLIQGAVPYGASAVPTALGGLGTSGGLWNQRQGIQAQRDIAKSQTVQDYYGSTMQAVSSIAGASGY